ncbi:MAG: hypothetical protein ACRDXE_03260 [Acidimicrobiales bacterium]
MAATDSDSTPPGDVEDHVWQWTRRVEDHLEALADGLAAVLALEQQNTDRMETLMSDTSHVQADADALVQANAALVQGQQDTLGALEKIAAQVANLKATGGVDPAALQALDNAVAEAKAAASTGANVDAQAQADETAVAAQTGQPVVGS